MDASVWVAAALPDDEHHAKTQTWLGGLGAETLVTPTLGLAELGGAVSRRTGSAALARRAIAALEKLPNVVIVLPDADLWTLAVRAATDRGLRGSDAVYVAVADALGMPLATWDGQQRDRAGRRVRVIAPSG